ncbi:choice-of-anchor X domain-containing protein [Ningiella sp. W23]|uniref:choice-of-anchor X domain-containing protein n=1 Tax=Ningiella sp. W23 TaxID=3023715 RepID=UPI003757B63D
MKKNQLQSGVNRRKSSPLKALRLFWAVCACVIILLSLGHKAHSAKNNEELSDGQHEDARSVLEKIRPVGTQYQNSIELLSNRFRIDDGIEKVIMVFFREFGAKPVVLVRPDGTKLFLDNDPRDDSYHWYESDTYDMIELVEPMPGPWQALGEVLPNSQILVIANLTLKADPIPSPVFSGETIKLSAVLQNAGNEVNFKEIRDIVSLSVDFISTNNTEFENFGLGTKNVARFLDDGQDLDESPGDGVFTGEFDLDIANGEWQAIYSVRTPLFSREQQSDNIVLLPNPISITHTEDESESKPSSRQEDKTPPANETLKMKDLDGSSDNAPSNVGFHSLSFDVNDDHIYPSSLVLSGTIRSPEGELEHFSITEKGDYKRVINIVNAGYGTYRIQIEAFATTRSGREVVLKVPEYTFVTKAPIVAPEPVIVDHEAIRKEQERIAALKAEEEKQRLITIAVSINVVLLVCGAFVIFLLADRRKRPDSHITRKCINKIKSLSFYKKMFAKKTEDKGAAPQA